MLIFVILSITDAYLISKLSHPCYHYHSRGAITVLCSPILFPYPLSYHQLSSSLPSPLCPLRSRFLLSRLCRPCPIIYPSSSLYPPPISSSISGPLRPLQSPSPPSATPPQYYDDTKSISSTYPMPTSYLTGIHESNQDDYMGQLTDNTYHNDYIEVVNKSTTNTIYHTYPTVILNKKNSKPTESILSSDQEFIHSSDKYLPRINHKNASTSSYMPTIGDNRFVDGNVKKYLIKTNCSITMLPQNDCCTKCSIPCRFRYGQIKISLNNDQFQEVDPICNNESMKQIIIEHANNDINRSKIRIQQAARQLLGGLFGVICGNDNFAYIIQTKDFCQHRIGNITCYIFRSLLKYDEINNKGSQNSVIINEKRNCHF